MRQTDRSTRGKAHDRRKAEALDLLAVSPPAPPLFERKRRLDLLVNGGFFEPSLTTAKSRGHLTESLSPLEVALDARNEASMEEERVGRLPGHRRHPGVVRVTLANGTSVK